MDHHVLLARQPIYNKELTLHGFELLFRSPKPINAMDVGEDAATFEVLVNYCTSISNEIDNSVWPLFVNVSENFILSEALLPMDQSRVVLEILERVEVTDKLVSKVAQLHQAGYRFALDDYDGDARWDPLFPYVELIKVDVLGADLNQIKALKERVSQKFSGEWLAERIEDREILSECIQMGFTLFQGYVLAKPKVLLGNTIRGSTAVTAQIIQLTCDPESDINEIAARVSQDPELSMQLLKLINSPLVNLNKPVSDLKQAITFLGTDMLRKWAMMMAFVSKSTTELEASRIILARARCCELYFLGKNSSQAEELASSAFLVGILSGVDVLLDIEPAFMVRQIQFSEEITNAILNQEGILAKVVNHVKAIEFILAQQLEKIQEAPGALLDYYAEAQEWAAQVIDSLQ